MRVVLQRVRSASVSVSGNKVSEITKGLLLLVGLHRDDTKEDAAWMAQKILNLRIFDDGNGKMNFSLKQVHGEILSVSQFTLYGDTTKGNRPGFDQAMPPEDAKALWLKFNDLLKNEGTTVKEGVFGADMDVSLLNDGPVTFTLESPRK